MACARQSGAFAAMAAGTPGGLVQPFDLSPKRARPRLIEPDLALVQGWPVGVSSLAMAPPSQPALIALELMREGKETGVRFEVRGGEATLGRYSVMTGPVDVDLGILQDHERFRIGLPHLRLALRAGSWRAEPLTWAYPTLLDGEALRGDGDDLEDKQLLAMGNALFRVHIMQREAPALVLPGEGPRLCLKVDGAPSGVVVPLVEPGVVLGRYSPSTGGVDVDLGGLPDAMQVTLARRHARFFPYQGCWCVESLTARGPVTINRHAAIRDVRALSTGDEVALGNVVFIYAEGGQGEATDPPDEQSPDTTRREGAAGEGGAA